MANIFKCCRNPCVYSWILKRWSLVFTHTQNPSEKVDPKLRGVWCISRASPVQWVEAAVGKESSTDGNKNCSTQGSFQKARAFGEMFGIWSHWSSVIFGKYTDTNGCWLNFFCLYRLWFHDPSLTNIHISHLVGWNGWIKTITTYPKLHGSLPEYRCNS